MRKITKRSAVFLTAAVVAVGGAGAAFAAWTLNTSKEASAVAGSAKQLNVSTPTIVGTLVPGSPVSVQFNAQNPNSFPVKVSNITFSEIHTGDETACPPSNLVAPDLTSTLAFAGNETKNGINLANALSLKTNADNGCQGATFTFKVNLVVASDSTV